MVGTGWIPGRRTHAAIFFADDLLHRQVLRSTESAGIASPLVHQLRQRFRQPVAKRLCHDRRVIVVSSAKSCRQLFDSMTGRHGEAAEIVDPATLARRDEISEGMIELAGWLF